MSVERKRHVLKSITWRVVASVTTFLISWSATGNSSIGLSIGFLDFVIKLVLYYGHERIWYRSKYGINEQDSGRGEDNIRPS